MLLMILVYSSWFLHLTFLLTNLFLSSCNFFRFSLVIKVNNFLHWNAKFIIFIMNNSFLYPFSLTAVEFKKVSKQQISWLSIWINSRMLFFALFDCFTKPGNFLLTMLMLSRSSESKSYFSLSFWWFDCSCSNCLTVLMKSSNSWNSSDSNRAVSFGSCCSLSNTADFNFFIL